MSWDGVRSDVGRRISATEWTVNSGSLASGAESSVLSVAHGLGVTPSIVVGHLEDGSWAHQCQWRVNSRDASEVTFRIRNPGPNAATAILRFRLVY